MAQPLELFLPRAGASPAAPSRPLGEERGRECWLAVHLPQADAAALEAVGLRALRLTPLVSLEPPEDLLLEVGGSLELFGGLTAIEARLSEDIEALRLNARLCTAPTARAALWLARCGSGGIRSDDTLAGRLGTLPVSATRWSEEVLALLRDMGLRTLGDCLRLPRAGFARRVGKLYLLELDEALGRQPSRRLPLDPPRRLSASIELAEESTDRALLAAAEEELVERLAAVLRRRQAQVLSLELTLRHHRGRCTTQRLRLIEPTHDEQRFKRLIHDKLERLELSEPVVAVGLRTGRLHPMRLREPTLFGGTTGAVDEAAASTLIERLRSRFGAEHVHGIEPAADHRPERAWAKRVDEVLDEKETGSAVSPWASHRPLWLLPAPLPLEDMLTPCAATLRAGPERIESGWWDGADAARDYYVLVAPRGERLWVYRQRVEPRGWFLHGIFG